MKGIALSGISAEIFSTEKTILKRSANRVFICGILKLLIFKCKYTNNIVNISLVVSFLTPANSHNFELLNISTLNTQH